MGPGGVEALKAGTAALRAAFPDLRAQSDEVIGAGEWVAAHLTWTGTHRRPFLGFEPTGAEVIARDGDGASAGRLIVELRQVTVLDALVAGPTEAAASTGS
jgi:hypothetical protein